MWNKKEVDDKKVQEAPFRDPSLSTTISKSPGRLGYIGQSIIIRGELSGNEDLTVDGNVEGKIDLKDHHLTIGGSGKVTAEIFAKSVTITGEVSGNVRADDRVEITNTGRVNGDIIAPRVSIADGAHFKGSVDMDGEGRWENLESNRTAE
ncbi:MAG: polymer-forming cytoskeletal protein [Acidobacteriota bacterium]